MLNYYFTKITADCKKPVHIFSSRPVTSSASYSIIVGLGTGIPLLVLTCVVAAICLRMASQRRKKMEQTMSSQSTSDRYVLWMCVTMINEKMFCTAIFIRETVIFALICRLEIPGAMYLAVKSFSTGTS